MIADPPVRADGSCVVCRKPRLTRLPKVITQRSKTELLDHLAGDPFCRTECARKWHRTELPEDATVRGQRLRRERLEAA